MEKRVISMIHNASEYGRKWETVQFMKMTQSFYQTECTQKNHRPLVSLTDINGEILNKTLADQIQEDSKRTMDLGQVRTWAAVCWRGRDPVTPPPPFSISEFNCPPSSSLTPMFATLTNKVLFYLSAHTLKATFKKIFFNVYLF